MSEYPWYITSSFYVGVEYLKRFHSTKKYTIPYTGKAKR